MMSEPPAVRFAIEAVRTAARLCQQIQKELDITATSKSDQSPVTIADFASQAVVAQMLMERFPDAVLVAEEDSEFLRTEEAAAILSYVTGYVREQHPGISPETVCEWIDIGNGKPSGTFWTLDPIDGTKGYLRGGQYVVALALIESGVVQVGALGCPQLNTDLQPDPDGDGCVLYAWWGSGAWIQDTQGGSPERLQVSNTSNASEARVLGSIAAEHTDLPAMDLLISTMGVKNSVLGMDSQAKYAVIAGGAGDLMFRLLSSHRPNYSERIWDHAAGSLIVEEAGGKVSDLNGAPLDFSLGTALTANIGVVVSNGHLHSNSLDVIRILDLGIRSEE
jgi:3'(2'), 5'-bisphosphate nucleotidase